MQHLRPQTKDLGGGFFVRRLLPALQRQSVGPFVFFDHFGPTVERPGEVHDVRPHPHIGLATVTYLFEGAIVHRDSTGVVQRIVPGAINWMTAGRGIVHSERSPEDLRQVERTTHGLQLWAALPIEDEEIEPAFHHEPSLPSLERGGATVVVLLGEAFGVTSPVPLRSPTLYLDLALPTGAVLALPDSVPERAIYTVEEGLTLNGEPLPQHSMTLLPPGSTPELGATRPSRAVLIGGEPLGHRFIWWNFVSSRRERIVQAADDWAAGRFPAVPGETEFIPLPDKRPWPEPQPL
jgi:redox-sensitive bicupin YhaK (pirin superfamily)